MRDAVRQCLSEFSFTSYLASFDTLSDEVRRCTGLLVKKVDSRALMLLVAELNSKSRTRRLRGLTMTTAMELASQVEERLLELLVDEDHFVRIAAVKALAGCNTPAARTALNQAFLGCFLHHDATVQQSLVQGRSCSRRVTSGKCFHCLSPNEQAKRYYRYPFIPLSRDAIWIASWPR